MKAMRAMKKKTKKKKKTVAKTVLKPKTTEKDEKTTVAKIVPRRPASSTDQETTVIRRYGIFSVIAKYRCMPDSSTARSKCHSKFWHDEENLCKKIGMTPAECKARASAVAKACMQRYDQYAAGEDVD